MDVFSAKRISKVQSLHLNAATEKIFPLFKPIIARKIQTVRQRLLLHTFTRLFRKRGITTSIILPKSVLKNWLNSWEKAINYYLDTGTILEESH